jgi:uncharacterized membrane protein
VQFIAGVIVGVVIGVVGMAAVVWMVACTVLHLADMSEGEALP